MLLGVFSVLRWFWLVLGIPLVQHRFWVFLDGFKCFPLFLVFPAGLYLISVQPVLVVCGEAVDHDWNRESEDEDTG